MFARAGISSRAFRGEHRGGFFGRPKKKKPKEKFRCYIPFMWSTCVAICGGFGVLCGGTAMCVTGYYAKNFTSTEITNGTDTWYEINPISYAIMWNMTYAGPVLMGFGCFAIVIACVVVCETRDKMLRIIRKDEKEGRRTTTKPDFYDLVIKKFKKEPSHVVKEEVKPVEPVVTFVSPPRRKSIFNMLLRRGSVKSIKSTKSEFSHIGSALRQIPMRIFAIDLEQSTKSSLLPISLTLGVDIGRMKLPAVHPYSLDSDLYLVPKYPSASCIVDLLKLNDEKLTSLFPDMNTWLAEVQPLSKKWRRMTRDGLVPFSPMEETQPASRDGDDSDNDSLCSVTVHVQPAKEKSKCQLSTIPAGDNDSNFYKFPPDPGTQRPSAVAGFNKDKATSLTVPGIDRHETFRRGASCDIETARKLTPVDKLGIRPVRRSLRRQKPVTDDSFPLQSPPPGKSSEFAIGPSDTAVPGCLGAVSVCDTGDRHVDDVISQNKQDGDSTHIIGDGGDLKHNGCDRTHTGADGIHTGTDGVDVTDPTVAPLAPVLTNCSDSPRSPGVQPSTSCHSQISQNNDLMQNVDIPNATSRTLLCSNDGDNASDFGGETNSLLSASGTAYKPLSLDVNDSVKSSPDGTPNESKNSLFIPYTPKESQARSNSLMAKSTPIARSLTDLDKTMLANVRTPNSSQVAPFLRHSLSQFHVESERLPSDLTMKKSKTTLGVTDHA